MSPLREQRGAVLLERGDWGADGQAPEQDGPLHKRAMAEEEDDLVKFCSHFLCSPASPTCGADQKHEHVKKDGEGVADPLAIMEMRSLAEVIVKGRCERE